VPKGDIARLLEMKKPPTDLGDIGGPTQQGNPDADQRDFRMPLFNRGSFVSSSASNFKSTSRSASVRVSARRFLNRVRFSL